MSVTSEKVLSSFLKNQERNIRNDSSVMVENACALFLHGNKIASIGYDGKTIFASLAGWPTLTTRDRLNALLDAIGTRDRIFQRKGRQYFGHHNNPQFIIELGTNEFFSIGQLPPHLWQEPRNPRAGYIRG